MPNLDDFQEDWRLLLLLKEGDTTRLSDVYTECIGEVGGGLFFYDNKGEKIILKCDEDGHCFKKVADTGDYEKDWEWIGDLIYDDDGSPFF